MITITILITIIFVITIAGLLMRRKMLSGTKNLWKQFMKNDSIIKLQDQWMDNRERGVSVESVILKNGFRHVALYGFGVLGKRLYKELKNSSIKVDYIVDRKKAGQGDEMLILSPDDDLKKTELMIITAIGDYISVREMMKKKLDCPIVSLEDVIYGN